MGAVWAVPVVVAAVGTAARAASAPGQYDIDITQAIQEPDSGGWISVINGYLRTRDQPVRPAGNKPVTMILAPSGLQVTVFTDWDGLFHAVGRTSLEQTAWTVVEPTGATTGQQEF